MSGKVGELSRPVCIALKCGFCQGGWAEDAAGRREELSSMCEQGPDGLGVIEVERGLSVVLSPLAPRAEGSREKRLGG